LLRKTFGGLAFWAFEASTYLTDKRYFKDTYFISVPQIKFPEGAAVLRANDDRFPGLLLLAVSGSFYFRRYNSIV
jgi:hypothetical protein